MQNDDEWIMNFWNSFHQLNAFNNISPNFTVSRLRYGDLLFDVSWGRFIIPIYIHTMIFIHIFCCEQIFVDYV